MQTPCFYEYFAEPLNQVQASSSPLIITPVHGLVRSLPDTGRPFVPIYGMSLDGTNQIYKPLTIASNQNNKNCLLNFAKECYNASVGTVNETPGSSKITSDQYAGYLYKKLYQKTQPLNRFQDLYAKVWNFWDNANVAWTADVYQSKLNDLINEIITQADKTLYCPNGAYDFATASQFIIDYTAWHTADATLAAIYGLEIYQ